MAHETTSWLDLIRHGEPVGGLRFRGLRDDPLTARGREQLWTAVGEERWELIITSPLLRCQAFAEELGTARRIPVEVDPRFRELDFGDWEGLAPGEIADQAAVRRFWSDPVGNGPPGGESASALLERVNDGLQDWLNRGRGGRLLFVCHGGVIRAAIAGSLDLPLGSVMQGFQVPYACRTRLRVDHGPHGTLRCLTAHGASG